MSGIVGSRHNIRGSGLVGSLGTDGQVFTSAGAGTGAVFEDAAGGGLTTAAQWRITTGFTGDAEPIASNWEEADAPTGFGVLGSSITESSGIFTFPSTGYWLIFAQMEAVNSGGRHSTYNISTTHDDSTYAVAAFAIAESEDNDRHTLPLIYYIFDVTSVSTHKARMGITQENAGAGDSCSGDSNQTLTGISFIRLGDT